jgi:hypothetical protein
MPYSTIVNPETGRRVKLHGKLGRKIIKTYLKNSITGGTNWLPFGPQTMVMCWFCGRPAKTNCLSRYTDGYGIQIHIPVCGDCHNQGKCKLK